MYVKKGRKLTVEEVFDFLKNQVNNVSDNILLDYAKQFVQVNKNLLRNKGVYGVLEKAPRMLDKGYHYFSIVYAENGDILKVYMPEIANLISAHINDKTYDIPRFCFRSNAVCMSRLLHATDHFFRFLASLGGCYAQIYLL